MNWWCVHFTLLFGLCIGVCVCADTVCIHTHHRVLSDCSMQYGTCTAVWGKVLLLLLLSLIFCERVFYCWLYQYVFGTACLGEQRVCCCCCYYYTVTVIVVSCSNAFVFAYTRCFFHGIAFSIVTLYHSHLNAQSNSIPNPIQSNPIHCYACTTSIA